jgi:hypothetical protein
MTNMKINYNEVYPIDVYGIAKIGVEDWLENYEPPFDPILYKERHLEIFNKYISIACTGSDEKINKFFIANFKVVLLILETMRNFEMKNNIKNNYKYVLSKKLIPIEDLSMEEISDSLFLKTFVNTSKSIKQKTRVRLKNFYLYIKYLLKISKSKKIYYIGTYNSDLENFIIQNKYFPQYFDPYLVSKSSKKTKIPDKINSRVVRLLDHIKFFNENQKALLQNKILKMLRNNWSVYENLLLITKSKDKVMLSNGLGSILHRLIITSWKINGGKCIGFMHGNSDYTSYSPEYIGYDGILVCDEIICKTDFQKKQLEKVIIDYGGGLNSAKIILQNEE